MTDDIGAPYQIPGPPVAANLQDRYLLSVDNYVLVITDSGQVFAHEIRTTVAPAYPLGGMVSMGTNVKWAVMVGYAIVVVSNDGSARTYALDTVPDVSGRRPMAIQAGRVITSPTPIAANAVDRFVLAQGNRFLVINSVGEVWAHTINSPTQFGIPLRIDVEVPVAANVVDKWAMFLEVPQDLVVITSGGDVWAHRLVTGPVGVPYKLSGPRVASQPIDRWVVPLRRRVLVVTRDGRVFAHQLFLNLPT